MGDGLSVYAYGCLSLRPQVLDPPGAGVIGGCNLPNVDTENQTGSTERAVHTL